MIIILICNLYEFKQDDSLNCHFFSLPFHFAHRICANTIMCLCDDLHRKLQLVYAARKLFNQRDRAVEGVQLEQNRSGNSARCIFLWIYFSQLIWRISCSEIWWKSFDLQHVVPVVNHHSCISYTRRRAPQLLLHFHTSTCPGNFRCE